MRDIHQEVREWMAHSGAQGLGQKQRSHLQECAACQEFADALSRTIRILRSEPVAARPSLVGMTQARVRMRAQRMQRERERWWFVCMACLVVGISGGVTTPILWRIFGWLGEWMGVSQPLWQAGFAMFVFVPALLVSVLLLVRGTYLSNEHGRGRA